MDASQQEAKALLALSHSSVEHTLYEALTAASVGAESRVGTFSLRHLLDLTGINSYSTLRRALAGLLAKQSIDCKTGAGEDGDEQSGRSYLVYSPEEIFERRRRAGLEPYPKEYRSNIDGQGFSRALGRVAYRSNLSRREAQVALCCAEGLTNAEIGTRLFITEQTVKFHLRHIFIKFGVRRRGELISLLLRHEDSDLAGLLGDLPAGARTVS